MAETRIEKMNGGQKWMKEKIKGEKSIWFCVKSIDFDIYFNLIHNNDQDCDVFDMIPKLGAMEISTVVSING